MEALSKRFKHSVTSMTVLKNASGGGAAVSGGSKQKGGKKPVDTAAGGSGDMIVLACTDGTRLNLIPRLFPICFDVNITCT